VWLLKVKWTASVIGRDVVIHEGSELWLKLNLCRLGWWKLCCADRVCETESYGLPVAFGRVPGKVLSWSLNGPNKALPPSSHLPFTDRIYSKGFLRLVAPNKNDQLRSPYETMAIPMELPGANDPLGNHNGDLGEGCPSDCLERGTRNAIPRLQSVHPHKRARSTGLPLTTLAAHCPQADLPQRGIPCHEALSCIPRVGPPVDLVLLR